MPDLDLLRQWAIPLAVIAAGLVLGLFFDVMLLGRLRALAERTSWQGDDIALKALRGAGTMGLTLGAVAASSGWLPVTEHTRQVVDRLVLVAAIVTATVIAANTAAAVLQHYASRREGGLARTSNLRNITRLGVFLIGALILLETLGISIAPLLTALGIGGLAVALALQDTLSNLFSGFHIILSRQVRVGDYVKLETGNEGYVTDITWRNTSIRTQPNNNMVIVPNSKMATSILTNYYQPAKELLIPVPVGVSYDSDLGRVEQVTLEVAREVQASVAGAVPEHEPFLRYVEFADFSINFRVYLRAAEFMDQHLLLHEFIKRLHRRYGAEGIEIPFPIRTVHLKPAATEPAARAP